MPNIKKTATSYGLTRVNREKHLNELPVLNLAEKKSGREDSNLPSRSPTYARRIAKTSHPTGVHHYPQTTRLIAATQDYFPKNRVLRSEAGKTALHQV